MKKLLLFLFILTVFTIHFTFTSIYILPFNPVKAASGQVNAYMQPFFTQNWQLFAPNPLSNNIYVYMQIEDVEGNQSEWTDLSTPIFESNHRNRISPNNRIVRIGPGSFMQTIHKDEVLSKVNERENNSITDNIIKEQDRKEVYQERGVDMLYRYASAYATKLYHENTIENIRVRVMIEEPIPFSQKDKPEVEGKKSFLTYEWEPIEKISNKGL